MSYCRWSSDHYRCDLYCYLDCDGKYVTHVAARRYDFPEGFEFPPPYPYGEGGGAVAAWAEKDNEFIDRLGDLGHVDIGLPHDGAMFEDANLHEFLHTLKKLKAAGYCFPDAVISEVQREINDMTTKLQRAADAVANRKLDLIGDGELTACQSVDGQVWIEWMPPVGEPQVIDIGDHVGAEIKIWSLREFREKFRPTFPVRAYHRTACEEMVGGAA